MSGIIMKSSLLAHSIKTAPSGAPDPLSLPPGTLGRRRAGLQGASQAPLALGFPVPLLQVAVVLQPLLQECPWESESNL